MLFGPYSYDAKINLSGPITRKDIAELKAQGFDLIINNRPDGEAPKQVPTAVLQAAVEAAGMRFVDIPFLGSKLSAENVDAFTQAAASSRRLLAMCATGTRSAMISAASDVRSGQPLQHALDKAKAAGFDLGHMDHFIAGFAKAAA